MSTPDFADKHSVRGHGGTVVSVTRSLRTEPLNVAVHEGEATRAMLWWSSMLVEVRPGDMYGYFPTPIGIAVEWVRHRQ